MKDYRKPAHFGHIFILEPTLIFDSASISETEKLMSTINKTIVLTDPNDIMISVAALFSNVKERLDCSADSNAPYSHFMLKVVRSRFIQLKDRGIKVKGTGLGLYISKSIIEAHHGKMWVENNNRSDTKCDGATFCFTLPVVDTRLTA